MKEKEEDGWPVIRWVDAEGGARSGDLADVLAAMNANRVDSFPALRPHQADAWHMLLVQLGVLATEKAGGAMPESASAWRAALLALTPEHPNGEPWRLVVDDVSKPAFMQPPMLETDFSLNKKTKRRLNSVSTPDDIDTIVNGMSHEIKSGIMQDARDDDWLFALVTLQTTQGSLGAGSLAVSRMNGGYASRSTMRIVPPGGASASFLRDASILLRERKTLAGDRGNMPSPLLWLQPFRASLDDVPRSLDLDPLYIEVCRRIRLDRRSDGALKAWIGSNPPTPSAASEKGVTGCPWTPIMLEGEKRSYTPGDDNDWRSVSRMFDAEKVEIPLLARTHPEDVDGSIVRLAGMKRGQGVTSRFDILQTVLPDHPDGTEAGFELLGSTLRDDPANGVWEGLRRALIAAAQNATDKIRFEHAASVSWAGRAAVNFQENLVEEIARSDAPHDPVNRRAAAVAAARRTFEEATAMLPGSGTPKVVSSIARAAGRLEAALRQRKEADEPAA